MHESCAKQSALKYQRWLSTSHSSDFGSWTWLFTYRRLLFCRFCVHLTFFQPTLLLMFLKVRAAKNTETLEAIYRRWLWVRGSILYKPWSCVLHRCCEQTHNRLNAGNLFSVETIIMHSRTYKHTAHVHQYTQTVISKIMSLTNSLTQWSDTQVST